MKNTNIAASEFYWIFKHGGVTVVDARLTYFSEGKVKDYRFESLPCIDDRSINSDAMKELRDVLETCKVCDISGFIVFYEKLPFLSEIRFDFNEQRVLGMGNIFANIIDINNKTKQHETIYRQKPCGIPK